MESVSPVGPVAKFLAPRDVAGRRFLEAIPVPKSAEDLVLFLREVS